MLKNELLRNAVSLMLCFFVVWYIGAMFNFLPFVADDFAVRAIGFTGLLLCIMIVVCTCWIINEIKKK